MNGTLSLGSHPAPRQADVVLFAKATLQQEPSSFNPLKPEERIQLLHGIFLQKFDEAYLSSAWVQVLWLKPPGASSLYDCKVLQE